MQNVILMVHHMYLTAIIIKILLFVNKNIEILLQNVSLIDPIIFLYTSFLLLKKIKKKKIKPFYKFIISFEYSYFEDMAVECVLSIGLDALCKIIFRYLFVYIPRNLTISCQYILYYMKSFYFLIPFQHFQKH